MTKLERQIREAIRAERIVYTLHAEERLSERGIERWQLIESFESGEVIESAGQLRPDPKLLVRQPLADGTDVIGVWTYVKSLRAAKLVTVYFERP